MTVHSIDPASRFDNLSVSSEVVDGRSLPIFAKYTCPNCGEAIQFTKQNLQERSLRRLTNLPAKLSAEFDAWAAAQNVAGMPYLDWPCPKCGLAARAYIEVWAGGKGDSGANIVALAEAEAI